MSSSQAWWRDAVVYQVYLRSFADGNGDGTGDIAGLRSRLPYISSLGVDALWINPWYAAIPAIRRLRLGRRIVHGLPGYEQAMREDFEYAALVEFDDVAGLRAYLAHPSHAAVGRHFSASSAAALAYDYELIDIGDRG